MIDGIESYQDSQQPLTKLLDLVSKNVNKIKLRLSLDYSKQHVKTNVLAVLYDKNVAIHQLILTS